MIYRDLTSEIIKAATRAPAITLTGPRQSGKTLLCKALFPDHPYRTLEDLDQRAFALEDPRTFLAQFPDGAVIDEVQRVPELLSYLQGIIDNNPVPGSWILSGSQNLSLLESVSQSLAGRTEVHQLLPLTWSEISRFGKYPKRLENTLFSGGYPRIFDRELDPPAWLRSYVATYLERDVRMLGNVGDLVTFQRFVELCAGRTGQLLNYSSLANDCGISQPTAKTWFGILEASFIAFRLPSCSFKLRKRLVKMPKLYFYDTGLVCWLLGIRESRQLLTHPLRGAIFETWTISEILKHRTNQGETRGLSFYRDSNGAEVDLIMEQPDGMTLLEAKSSATPAKRLFDSVRRVQRHFPDAPLPEMAVVYGGEEFQQRAEGRLIPWRMLRVAALPNASAVVRVSSGGHPLAHADILALFPNKTFKSAQTDEHGEARLDLHSIHLPMSLFVTANGFGAHLQQNWVPAEQILHVNLSPLQRGGSVIFPLGTGHIPGLSGRLNPIRDTHNRIYLHADNIAINGGQQHPVSFQPGGEIHLADADGGEVQARVIEIIGTAALVEYRQCPVATDAGS